MVQFPRVCAIGIVLLAQAAPPPRPSQQPPFRVETSLVRVDAYATKDGVPVADLGEADFEVLEDNTPQKIASFEHIVVPSIRSQDALSDPSPSAANQLAADPRRRVFVIYLDYNHVGVQGSHAIQEPLIEFMQRVMSDDDLVGVMTPDMSPSQIAFGRRTRVIEDGLRKNWAWGRRGTLYTEDERERMYDMCFPPGPGEPGPISALAKTLITRRRERIVLESLRDLTMHMASIREGRTAVVTVSDGWLLFKPDPSIMKQRIGDSGAPMDPMPGTPPPVGVGRKGTLTTRPNQTTDPVEDRTACDADRAQLAMIDNDSFFRDLLGNANRANVSFYTIDPRGLSTYDEPLGLDPPLPPEVDRQRLTTRMDTLMTLAANTDGMAMVNDNDLRKQIRRIVDDLTSYYLIGYYSTNSKLDGRFRTIKVRSKRPGIEVRARRGYRAATQEEVSAARASASAPVAADKAALNRALGSIESDARAQGRRTARGEGEPVVLHRGPATGNAIEPAAGRVFPRSERIRLEMEAASGGSAWTGVILDRNGSKTIVPVVAGERTDAGGQRWLTADITLAPLGAGDYVVELTTISGTEQKKTLVAIRVTQ